MTPPPPPPSNTRVQIYYTWSNTRVQIFVLVTALAALQVNSCQSLSVKSYHNRSLEGPYNNRAPPALHVC